MHQSYSILEFAKIKEMLLPFAKTETGKSLISSIDDFIPKSELDESLKKVDEAMMLILRYGQMPIFNLADIDPYLALVSKGGCLTIEQLVRISSLIECEQEVKKFLLPKEFTKLNEIIIHLKDISPLKKEIERVISPNLEIYDDASNELRSIRRDIRRREKEMEKTLSTLIEQNQEFLTTKVLTLKNGHYVLPVNISYKNKVKGIIQDVSNSGMTAFIEPESIVSINNILMSLKNDEKEEIMRILKELSAYVDSFRNDLSEANRAIAELDFIQAKALFGNSKGCHIASISSDKSIILKQAKHPLLDVAHVVPNDFLLNSGERVIIISGPNAGGKTVALKTLGLLSYMHQCGLPIPVEEGSSLPYFTHIYVDIGDSQSISDNLSTFSGHIKNISSILNVAGGNDLVLLDEVGTGTSPKEGEAIAYAVVVSLLKKHCYALISSHFEGLKAYALNEKEVRNASMLFDEFDLTPTYVLKMGLPGESYGLEVAKRFGLPEETLQIAREYVKKDVSPSITDAIKKLSEEIKEAEKIKANNLKVAAEQEEKENKLDRYAKTLEGKEARLNEKYAQEKEELLEKYKEELDEMIESLKKEGTKIGEIKKAKEMFDEVEEDEKFNDSLSVGDWVDVPSFYVSGKLVNLKGNKATIITEEGLTIETTKERIKKGDEPIIKKKRMETQKNIDHIEESLPLELNILGYRAEEGKEAIINYLDRCRVKGYKRVRIIHGFGTGALRKVTTEYLSSHKEFVEKFEPAGPGEGGGGATIVYLK